MVGVPSSNLRATPKQTHVTRTAVPDTSQNDDGEEELDDDPGMSGVNNEETRFPDIFDPASRAPAKRGPL